MSAVSLLLPQLTVQLTDTNVGVTPMVVPDPSQLFFGMCVGVLTVGPMRLGHQRFLGAVVQPIPTHKGRFGNVITTQNKVNILGLAIQSHGIDLCGQFMR